MFYIDKNRDSLFKDLDIRDPEEAFKNAIAKGLRCPEEWMYMYTDNGRDYFKHIATRCYKSFKHKW